MMAQKSYYIKGVKKGGPLATHFFTLGTKFLPLTPEPHFMSIYIVYSIYVKRLISQRIPLILLRFLVCVFYILSPLYGEHIRAALPVLPISPPAGDGPCDWWLLHRIREYLGCIYLQTYVHIGYHIFSIYKQPNQSKDESKNGTKQRWEIFKTKVNVSTSTFLYSCK